MHAATIRPARLDWRRVGAFGTTFLLHAVAALLVAVPVAATLAPMEMPAPTVEARVLEMPPPPALPLPPEPVATPKPRPRVRATQASAPASIADATVPREPIPPAEPRMPGAPVASATTPTAEGTAVGETRVLAYDGAIRLRYPLSAIRRSAHGTVLLRVLVDRDGAVRTIEIARSSGQQDLDRAARDAVRNARFRPVLENGVAIPAWGLVPIEFRLDRG